MGPIDCFETSVRNYHYSLHNSPEERSSETCDTLRTLYLYALALRLLSSSHIHMRTHAHTHTNTHTHRGTQLIFQSYPESQQSVPFPLLYQPSNSYHFYSCAEKRTVVPLQAMMAHVCEAVFELRLFLTSQISRPGRFSPRKERRYLLNRRLGRNRSQSGRCE
jgi:hypothetical protein